MPEKKSGFKHMKNVLRGAAVWLAALLLLTVLTALLTEKFRVTERTTVYLSSALTFLSSAAAGNMLRRNDEKITFCILLSFVLIVLALSVGFLWDSSRIDPGGILSVASFTLCGALTGYVLNMPKKKRSKIKI